MARTAVLRERFPPPLGTNLGIRFAVLSVVEKGKTFTLWVKQVGSFESKISLLREMLDYAEKLFNPNVVLLDRGFYSALAIKELKSRNREDIETFRVAVEDRDEQTGSYESSRRLQQAQA